MRIILILGLFFINSIAWSTNKDEKFLSFSEMTVDKCPGEEGSWIELYNPTEEKLPFKDFSIVCNNKEIFSSKNFKGNLKFLPPYCFIVIKFVKKVNRNKYPNGISLSLYKRQVTYYVKALENIKLDPTPMFKLFDGTFKKYWRKNRCPGYCALFVNSKQTKENLYDYVTWGSIIYYPPYPEIFKNKIASWAEEKNIKFFGDLGIGIDTLFGGYYAEGKAGIARIGFKDHSNLSWKVIGDYTTFDGYEKTLFSPGKANPLQDSIIISPGNGENVNADEIKYFRFSIDSRLTHLENNIKVRYQLAKDPYFEKIVFDGENKTAPKILKKILAPGTYYMRAKIDMKKYQTNWSPTVVFKYNLEEKQK